MKLAISLSLTPEESAKCKPDEVLATITDAKGKKHKLTPKQGACVVECGDKALKIETE